MSWIESTRAQRLSKESIKLTIETAHGPIPDIYSITPELALSLRDQLADEIWASDWEAGGREW